MFCLWVILFQNATFYFSVNLLIIRFEIILNFIKRLAMIWKDVEEEKITFSWNNHCYNLYRGVQHGYKLFGHSSSTTKLFLGSIIYKAHIHNNTLSNKHYHFNITIIIRCIIRKYLNMYEEWRYVYRTVWSKNFR